MPQRPSHAIVEGSLPPSPSLRRRASVVAWAVGMSMGCNLPVDEKAMESTGSTGTEPTGPTSEPAEATANGETTGTTTPPSSTETFGATTGGDDTGSVFIPPVLDVVSWYECDIFDPQCPPGDKCMPWAHDGGNLWNATRCVPVVLEPDGVGEPCEVQGSPYTGIDTCDHGAMCFHVDPDPLQGICVEFCVGSRDDPQCESAMASCWTSNTLPLALCFPWCDPLLQSCPSGQACHPAGGEFMCEPDVSGDMGAPGDPCEFINACDPGSSCASSELVPECMGAGCCSPFCALDDPMPPCLPGQDCVPWYEPGAAPPGYENVGACAVPM